MINEELLLNAVYGVFIVVIHELGHILGHVLYLKKFPNISFKYGIIFVGGGEIEKEFTIRQKIITGLTGILTGYLMILFFGLINDPVWNVVYIIACYVDIFIIHSIFVSIDKKYYMYKFKDFEQITKLKGKIIKVDK